MDLLRLAQCLAGKHYRDRRKAWTDERGIVRSVCKGCGCAMYKDFGRWKKGTPG